MARWHLAPHLRPTILATGLCAAATSATAEPDGEADRLRLLESMARRAYSDKRYQDAIDAFEAAYLMKANPKYLYNIGRCEERLGAIDRAIEYLTTYVEQIQDPKDRADAETVLAVLRVRLSRAHGAPPPTRLAGRHREERVREAAPVRAGLGFHRCVRGRRSAAGRRRP